MAFGERQGDAVSPLRLLLVGFGNVGREFVRLLAEREEEARAHLGRPVRIVGIVRSRGILLDIRGLPPKALLAEAGPSLEGTPEASPEAGAPATRPSWREATDPHSVIRLIRETGYDVLVELTPLNVHTGEPAASYIAAALESEKDVVTANKGPMAIHDHYHRLRELARSKGRRLRFEGAVMDGTPVFNLVEKTLPGCRVLGFRGVLNSTTNFVLGAMEAGRSLADAVKEAQEKGFAESDPALDLEGWDAAAKTAALVNVLLDGRITPKDVERQGITGLDPAYVAGVVRKGKRLKLISSARMDDGRLTARVELEELGPEDPLALVAGTSSALTLETDLMGRLTLFEHDPTLLQTAYAVYGDLLQLGTD